MTLGLWAAAVAAGLFAVITGAGSDRAELPGQEAAAVALVAALPWLLATWAAGNLAMAAVARVYAPITGRTQAVLAAWLLLAAAPVALFGSLEPTAERLASVVGAQLLACVAGCVGVAWGARGGGRVPGRHHGAWGWLAVAGVAVLLLARWGTGPVETRLNLHMFGRDVQLLEVVPYALALSALGVWSAHRERTVGPLAWVAWTGALAAILGAVVVVLDDRGAALIVVAALGLLCVYLFDAVRVVPAPMMAACVVGGLAVVSALGRAHASGLLALRFAMQADPWHNGLPNGEQLAMALAMVEMGAWDGIAAWCFEWTDLRVAESDMVVPLFAGIFGFPAALAWIATWWATCARLVAASAVDDALFPGARRAAAAVAAVFGAKLLVVLYGALGVTAMTGAVATLLGEGDTALCTAYFFLGYACGCANRPLRSGTVSGARALRHGAALLGVLLLPPAGVLVDRGTAHARGEDHLGWVTTEGDGVLRQVVPGPLRRVADRHPRAALLDRRQRVLAVSPPGGGRLRTTVTELHATIGKPGDVVDTLEALVVSPWPRAAAPVAFVVDEEGKHPRRGDDPGPGERVAGLPADDLRGLHPLLRLSPGELAVHVATAAHRDAPLDRALARRLSTLPASYMATAPKATAFVLVARDGDGRLLATLSLVRPGTECARLTDAGNLPANLRGPVGSLMKALGAANADLSGVPHDVILPCTKGPGGRGQARVCDADGGCEVIRDFPKGRHADVLTVDESMELSCNSAAISMALMSDPDAFASLYAEVSGGLPPNLGRTMLYAETALGQGIAELSAEEVSALYLGLGVDGMLRPGTLADGLEPPLARRLVPVATAVYTRSLLHRVVYGDHGTARAARLPPPLTVVAKSGTAQEPPRGRPDDPHLGDDAWLAGVVDDGAGKHVAFTILALHADRPGGTLAPLVPALAEALQAEGYLGGGRAEAYLGKPWTMAALTGTPVASR